MADPPKAHKALILMTDAELDTWEREWIGADFLRRMGMSREQFDRWRSAAVRDVRSYQTEKGLR